MKIKKIFLISLALLFSVNMGCYPTGEISSSDDVTQYISENENDTDKNDTFQENSETQQESFDNLILNCSLPKTPKKVFEFSSNPKTWDKENLKNIFLSNKGDISEQSYESDFTPGEIRYVYNTPKQSRLITESGYITYSDLSNPNRDEYTMLQSSWSIDDMNKLFGNKELEGFPKSQAIKAAKQTIEKCGIQDYGTPTVYPLHANKVNKYFSENFDGMEKKDGSTYQVKWSNNEEAYLIVFPQLIDKTPISLEQTYISLIITRSNITEFSVVNWMNFNKENEISADVKYSSKDAANILIDYYNSIILDSPVEITDCKLSLYPTTAVYEAPIKYVPVWEFTTKAKQENGQYVKQQMNISAITGKQIVRQDQ